MAIVRPMLTYAAFIWWPRCRIGLVQKKLSKIQRLALIGITGAMKTTPTIALEGFLNIAPLHIHVEEVARATCLRLYQSSLLKCANYGHSNLWNIMRAESPFFLCLAIKSSLFLNSISHLTSSSHLGKSGLETQSYHPPSIIHGSQTDLNSLT